MNIITVINAKGGCGKSTIAMNLSAGLAQLGFRTLLIDMDPQAQVTQWLGLGDGLTADGTLVMVLAGKQTLACRRRFKSEPPRRPNIEPGVEADFEMVGCG